ncbi:MAG: tautomerase family protein [Actinomycetota bacterium]|nr:tautomerase family protein [Actinomycetota bacterium]
MDVTIVILESAPENWGVRGGQPASEVDLGFAVEI